MSDEEPVSPEGADDPKGDSGWSMKTMSKLMDETRRQRIANEAIKVAEIRKALADREVNAGARSGLIVWEESHEPLPSINLDHPLADALLKSDQTLLCVWQEMFGRQGWDEYITDRLVRESQMEASR
jgi:hypothetical protein